MAHGEGDKNDQILRKRRSRWERENVLRDKGKGNKLKIN